MDSSKQLLGVAHPLVRGGADSWETRRSGRDGLAMAVAGAGRLGRGDGRGGRGGRIRGGQTDDGPFDVLPVVVRDGALRQIVAVARFEPDDVEPIILLVDAEAVVAELDDDQISAALRCVPELGLVTREHGHLFHLAAAHKRELRQDFVEVEGQIAAEPPDVVVGSPRGGDVPVTVHAGHDELEIVPMRLGHADDIEFLIDRFERQQCGHVAAAVGEDQIGNAVELEGGVVAGRSGGQLGSRSNRCQQAEIGQRTFHQDSPVGFQKVFHTVIHPEMGCVL